MGESAANFIDELRHELARGSDDAIWDYDDVANYLKVKRETVKKMKVNDPSFPKAVHYARGRFRAGEIKEWALRSSRV